MYHIWKKIDEDLIESFLNKISERCSYSLVNLEEFLLDVIYEKIKIMKEEDYDFLLMEKNEEINNLISYINNLVKKIDDSKELNKQLRIKYKKLKENSVIFSTDIL